MDTMKCDMAGAAAVIQATFAIAALGLPIKVTTFAPMAENMVSGSATRPGDVLTMYGGTTVEVLNTDAEGRLVLADAPGPRDRAEARRDPRRRHPDRPHGARPRRAGRRRARLGGRRRRRARGRQDRRRGAVADADPGVDDRADPEQQDRRPGPARLDPLGRRPVRRRVPARVHRRAAVGAPRHRRARRSTPAAPTATSPPAAPASRSAPWSTTRGRWPPRRSASSG